MEAIRNYEWAQSKMNEMTGQGSDERHEEQRQHHEGENRTDRRARERYEKKAAKRKAKA